MSRRRLGLLGGLGILIVLAVRMVVDGGTTTLVESYRLIDEDTIVIESLTGEATWTRVTDVRESTDVVRITVKSLSAPVPHTAIGIPIEFVIDLEQPLGDRVVLDGSGEVPRRP